MMNEKNKTIVMNSMSEIMDACNKLLDLEQGWECLPSDEPEVASFGMTAFRDDENMDVDDEMLVRYEWLPYGKRLEPVITVAENVKQFRSLVNKMRPNGIFPCDDPKNLRIGFVSYNGEKANVARISLIKLKDLDKDDPLNKEIAIRNTLRMDRKLF